MSIQISGQNLFPCSKAYEHKKNVCSFCASENDGDVFVSRDVNPKYKAIATKIDNVWNKIAEGYFNARLKLYKKFGSPDFSHPEINSAYTRNTFNNLEMCKNFTGKEKELLHDCLFEDGNEFFITMNGQKPASIIGLENHNMKFLDKLKMSNYGKNFDFIHQKPWKDRQGNIIYSTYAVNRKQTLNVIEQNRDIFTSRLNLDKDVKTKEIYRELFSQLRKGFSAGKDNYFHDLEGIIFGFPKYDCMIFELEAKSGNLCDERDNPEKFKKMILKTLYGKKSPYKNLPEKEFKALEEHINSIEKPESFYNGYYAFIDYCNDESAIRSINKRAEVFNKTFSVDSFNKKFKD